MKTAARRIKSQEFLTRKLITDPAVLKVKLTMDPMSPGSIPAIFFPSSLSPFPTPFATDLNTFESELTITPMTVPTAKRTGATVNPHFLKMSLTLSLGDALSSSSSLSFSRASICSLFSVILSRALSLSEGCSFSSLAIISSARMDFCSCEFLYPFVQSILHALDREHLLFLS